MGSILHHITPLASGTDTQTHVHTDIHTDTDTHTLWAKSFSRNQVSAGLLPVHAWFSKFIHSKNQKPGTANALHCVQSLIYYSVMI